MINNYEQQNYKDNLLLKYRSMLINHLTEPDKKPETRRGDTIRWDSICIRSFFPFNGCWIKDKKALVVDYSWIKLKPLGRVRSREKTDPKT